MAENVNLPQQSGTRLAALAYLCNALDDLSLPIKIAERWVHPDDLPAFVEEVETRIRAFAGFIDDYLERHPRSLREADRETYEVLDIQLASSRKSLHFLSRIGKPGTEADAGKSNAEIVREEIRKAFAAGGSAPDRKGPR
jgi:hypothetical protein